MLSPRAAGFTPSDGKRADASGKKAFSAQAISASLPLGQLFVAAIGHLIPRLESCVGVCKLPLGMPRTVAPAGVGHATSMGRARELIPSVLIGQAFSLLSF